MSNTRWRTGLVALAALALTLAPAVPVAAQASATTHKLNLSNVVESVDAKGRIILVGTVTGDLPGILTLALVVAPSGVVTGGEWALTVSYTEFGPITTNGDGDASESLVQRGVLKGSVLTGVAAVGINKKAIALSGIQLHITGATVQYAATTKGSGTVTGSNLNLAATSVGSLSLTF